MYNCVCIYDGPGIGWFELIRTEGKSILLHHNNNFDTSAFAGFDPADDSEVRDLLKRRYDRMRDEAWERYMREHPTVPPHNDAVPLISDADHDEHEREKKQRVANSLNEVLKWIESGADVNTSVAICETWEQDCKAGYTLLMMAAMHDEWKIARLLIRHGANLNAQAQSGDTALSLSQGEFKWRTYLLLRRAGA